MGRRIIALVTPKGLRSREPRKKTPPQRSEKHQKESQVPSVVTSASSEGGTAQHIRDVAALRWGDKRFSKSSPNVAVFSPLHQSDKAAGLLQEGSESRQTSAGWKVQPQRLGPGCSQSRRRFSEPRLTSTGRRDHHSPGCSSGKHSQTLPAETGPFPTELSQCSKAGDACGVREFLPRVPGRAAPWGAASSGHRRSWACLCSPSSWCIQDFFLGISPTVSYCSGN